MATGRRPPDGPDIPDLDTGSRRPATSGSVAPRTSGVPAAKVSAPPSRPARSSDELFGSGTFDADHFEGSNVTIALDTEESRPAGGDGASYFGGGSVGEPIGDLDLYESSAANAEIAQSVPAPAPDRRKWPTGTSPDPPALRIDSVDVVVAGAFGPAPQSLLGVPAYALRVLARKRGLQAKLKELSAAFEQAARKRDELLTAMAQDLRGKILMAEQGDTLFEPIVAIERVAMERRSALTGTNAEYDARAAELANHGRATDQGAADQRAVVEQRAAALAELVRSFERADAKKKRLYIELGGLVRISEKAGGKLTIDQAASVARLETEIAAQKPELDAAARAVEKGKSSLVQAESAEREILGKARDADRLRQALDLEFRKEIGARNEGVTEAEQQRFEAFAELGRKVLAERGRLADVRTEVLDAITHADQAVLDRAVELEKHVRARDSYDAEALKTGLGVLAFVLASVLVALIVLAFF